MTIDCLFLPAAAPERLDDDLPVVRAAPGAPGRPLRLAEAAQAPATGAAAPVALVLPVERVTACAVTLPTRRTRWLRQALPFAVEELLAEDPERLHFALGEALADGRHRVIAIDRALLSGWLEQLAARGLEVASIHVDADLLPPDGATRVAAADPARGLLAAADGERLAFEPASWPALAASCPAPVHAIGTAAHCALPGLDHYRQVGDLHGLLAAGRGGAIDLAQGTFAREPADRVRHPRRWLALAAAALVLQLGTTHGQAWYLERQAATHYAASEAIYRHLFPQDHRIVDLRAQFDAHMAGGGGGRGFVALLEAAAGSLADDPGITVVGLDYTAEGGLALQLEGGDPAGFERLREHLRSAGWAATLTPSDADGTAASARLLVGGRA